MIRHDTIHCLGLGDADPNVVTIKSTIGHDGIVFINGMVVGRLSDSSPVVARVPSFPFRLSWWRIPKPGYCNRYLKHYLEYPYITGDPQTTNVYTISSGVGIPPSGCAIQDPPVDVTPIDTVPSTDPALGASNAFWPAWWYPQKDRRVAPFLAVVGAAVVGVAGLRWWERRS